MARAYKKTYLNNAMRNLAVMMDCGVRKYGYSIEEFYQKFLACDVSRQFAAGNPVNMYHPLHEADLTKFADAADGIITRQSGKQEYR